MDLLKLRNLADLILKSLSIIAIVVGGVWAFYQYRITETSAFSTQITVSSETLPYGRDSRLLLIHSKPKNLGKVLVTPGNAGLVVTVRIIPEKMKNGVVNLDDLPVVYTADLLKRYPDGYELEPGVEFDEVVALVVPKGRSYAIKATLDVGDNTEVDHTTIARSE